MPITTTESLSGKVHKPIRCSICNWADGALMTRGDDHRVVHFYGCPPGRGPDEDTYTAIGHDPFAEPMYLPGTRVEVFQADIRALELLKANRVGPYAAGLTTEHQDGTQGYVRERINLEAARKRVERSPNAPSFPGESAEEDAFLKGQAAPLGAGRRVPK